MDDFRIKNGIRLKALALAFEALREVASPAEAGLADVARGVVADAWRVLAWQSGDPARHACAVEEGIAERTTALDLGNWAATLAGRPGISPRAWSVWPAVTESLRHGPFDGPCPVLEFRRDEALVVAMPGAVTSFPQARLGLLPHASVAGAHRAKLDGAPDEVLAARARLREALSRAVPAAVTVVRGAYEPLRDFARAIDGCDTMRDLCAAFPRARSLFSERAAKPPVDACSAALLRQVA